MITLWIKWIIKTLSAWKAFYQPFKTGSMAVLYTKLASYFNRKAAVKYTSLSDISTERCQLSINLTIHFIRESCQLYINFTSHFRTEMAARHGFYWPFPQKDDSLYPNQSFIWRIFAYFSLYHHHGWLRKVKRGDVIITSRFFARLGGSIQNSLSFLWAHLRVV
jgi:hypothetical protein